ncbi:MAG: BatA and WFA domain-containing protein [Bacteroidales bacterium]|nr:BatA and WFA domain-containing protein [Bacteroidales bacterium]
MSFLYPGFLFALFAISIPVIIHLFRFRRFRTIYFPNIAFLQQLSEASDRESRLKHLLVLLARILTISFLVMAFSRPYIPAEDEAVSPEGNIVGVYIDNSFSMNARSAYGSLLDEAKTRAQELASIYMPADRFMLLTNDFEGRHQRFVSREEFLALIEEVELSPVVRTLTEVMTRKADLFSSEPQGRHRAYYISDFQKSTTGLEMLEDEPEPKAYFIPLEAARTDNVFIDSCWFESPVRLAGQPLSLHVLIRNDGSQNLSNQPLRLFIDGQQRAVTTYDVAAGSQTEAVVGWTAGNERFQQGWIEIIDYPVTFDDRLYFSYAVSSEINVLTLEAGQANPYLGALYRRDDLFNYSSVPAFSIDYSAFARQSLIILNGFNQISGGLAMQLQRFVEEGGSLAVFPGTSINKASYSDFLMAMDVDSYTRLDTNSLRVSEINELHPLFEGVFEELPENIDLPRVSSYYAVSRQLRSSGQNLLVLQNGLPFFASYAVGEGAVYLSAVPIDDAFSNFQRHSIFVPVMVNIALHSNSRQPLYHVLEPMLTVGIPGTGMGTDQVFALVRDGFRVIPEQRQAGNRLQLIFHDQLREAHNYLLFHGEELYGPLSLNYDRRESLLEAHSRTSIERILADSQIHTASVLVPGDRSLDQMLRDTIMGRQLWRFFIILALTFLLAEVAILRWWK